MAFDRRPLARVSCKSPILGGARALASLNLAISLTFYALQSPRPTFCNRLQLASKLNNNSLCVAAGQVDNDLDGLVLEGHKTCVHIEVPYGRGLLNRVAAGKHFGGGGASGDVSNDNVWSNRNRRPVAGRRKLEGENTTPFNAGERTVATATRTLDGRIKSIER